MPDINARVASEVELQAVVTRADGTVEDLGTIYHWHKSPWRRLWWRLMQRSK